MSALHFLQQLFEKERREREVLTKHSKIISNCQKQIHYGHEADWDVQSLSGKRFC